MNKLFFGLALSLACGSYSQTVESIEPSATTSRATAAMGKIQEYQGDWNNVEVMLVTAAGQTVKTDIVSLVSAVDRLRPIPNCSTSALATPSWSSAVEKLFSVCPQVKVGIGTAFPEYSLDVRGTASAYRLLVGNRQGSTAGIANIYSVNHTMPILQLGKKIGALPEEIRFTVNSTGAVVINKEGSQTALTINNNGGHAIVVKNGSGAKIAQLEGTGLFRARSVRVDYATWADYVFEAGYDLMPLQEVASFITKNGHLPEVPSAEVVEKEGLDLGDMQRIQMQKIEELTLHLIEMNDRVKELERENEILKN